MVNLLMEYVNKNALLDKAGMNLIKTTPELSEIITIPDSSKDTYYNHSRVWSSSKNAIGECGGGIFGRISAIFVG